MLVVATLAQAFPGGSDAAPAPGSTRVQPMMRSEAAATVDAQGATKLFPALGSLLASAPKPALPKLEEQEAKEDMEENNSSFIPLNAEALPKLEEEEAKEDMEEDPEELFEENTTEEENPQELISEKNTEEEDPEESLHGNTTEEEDPEELLDQNTTEEAHTTVMSIDELQAYKDNVCGYEGGTCTCNGVAFFGTPDGDGVRADGSIACSAAALGGTTSAATGKTPCLCYTLKWCTDNKEFKQEEDPSHRRRSIMESQGRDFHQRRRWCGWGPRNCIWAAWDRWGSCSATCGTGTKTRKRARVVEAANGGSCHESNVDSVTCYMATCRRRRYR